MAVGFLLEGDENVLELAMIVAQLGEYAKNY